MHAHRTDSEAADDAYGRQEHGRLVPRDARHEVSRSTAIMYMPYMK
jgi:hypothetical protein